MIFVLVLQATLGYAMLGQFNTEKECEEHGLAYLAMLKEQRTIGKYNTKVSCVGVPDAFPEPREMWAA